MFFIKKYFSIGLLIFLILGTTHFTFGQQIVSPDSALEQILNNLEGTELSLSQAQQYAQKNSTSVRQAEAFFLAASGILRRERGEFDPELFFNFNYQDQKIPTASFFSGAPVLATQQTTAETGVRLNLPIGTKLELSINSVRLKTNSQLAFLNPEYDAFGSLALRQPLLKGFDASARKELKQAELNEESAKAQYDQAILAANSSVEVAYWSLYAAERNYAVQKLTLERAEALLREAQLREQAGLVGLNQVATAKTFWAEQKLILIDRDEQLGAQSDMLASLIGKRPEKEFSRFLTISDPPTNFPIEDVESLVEYVRENNLNLKAAKNNIEASNALVDAASWEALPSVDIVGSLTSTGLGGNSQDVIFGGDTLRATTSGSFGDGLSQVFNRKFPGWSVGVEINLPIGLRKGLGEEDRLKAGVINAKQNYIELSRQLEERVRNSHRELSHGNERLKIAKEGVEAAQEQVRIGMIEFQNGRLSAFELVHLGEDFAVAQQRYSEALVKTVKAASDLSQLTSGWYLGTK